MLDFHKQLLEVLFKNGVLKGFSKFIGKHLGKHVEGSFLIKLNSSGLQIH